MTTKTATSKTPVELLSFYGGQVQIERRKWGDHYRYKRIWGDSKESIIFATNVTKNLDKSRALLPWAIGLVGSHITSSLEGRTSLHKDEIITLVQEAMQKPDEAKVKGGSTGDIIHDFALAFAKNKLEGTPFPTIDHLDEEDEEGAKALNGINAFLDFYNNNKVEFVEMEKLVYYNSLLAGDTKKGEPIIEFGGILDLLARVNGQLGVWDYKTGKAIYSDQRYQNSCYFKAYNSDPDNKEKATVSGILNFGKETGELVMGQYTASETMLDYEFGFKGLYLCTVREKQLEAEREALKKEETK